MRVGLIADIHGNLPALHAVFDAMPDVDRLVCAGDLVGYYPWPVQVLETIRSRSIPCVQGNHDRAIAADGPVAFNRQAVAGVEFAREALSAQQRNWLGALPIERSLLDERVTVVHGHPDNPDHYTYPEEFSPALLDGAEVLVLGHTHVQHADTYDAGIVVNPGSVGQPRDGDPRAAFAVVDLAELTVDQFRVEYDVGRVREAIEREGLPAGLGSRLEAGR